MEAWLHVLLDQAPLIILAGVIGASFYALAQGANWLIDEAVTLSERWRVPKALIGATIVSLGTTLPEATVSVLAAVQGNPGLALGNAVGSIICDTGLILGLATLISPLPLVKSVVNRQGFIQVAAAVLLVVLAFPFPGWRDVLGAGGNIPRWAGFLMLGLLAAYLYISIIWARRDNLPDGVDLIKTDSRSMPWVFAKLVCGAGLVVISSQALITAVEILALRIGVPSSIVAATLVAFGTSLPELVTSLTAVRRGHGEIAVGNIIGADILNVLFVTGAATAATRGGLEVPVIFFTLYFPAMLGILLLFRAGAWLSGDYLKRWVGGLLLLAYLVVTIIGY
ncbi:MAG TPA: sodium:calcium antiporter [Candidatus Omnitrophota bacterium]|nr:sodium:calcium antiporter [Candidatus Omnitrophota bacterium]HRY85895.1 sodium:calcium antiporter [Candidatus Omnitrophota bacterium]